jgi:acetolactate synthase-1/2/3 large subunit
VSRCFAELQTPEMILVGELGLDQNQLESTLPGTYFTAPSAGVLGWGLGAALGAKLAARDRTVVCHVGDGSYMFGAPTAAHWIARKMDLPVLFLVWNNARWNAVENSTRSVFPEGWAAKEDNFVFTDLSPSLDLEMVCQAAGGYAERVDDPDEVPAALKRALHAVQVEGRQAMLNFIGAAR